MLLLRVIVDGHLAGNAFACHWAYNVRSLCWITQLVVHRDYRERGLAIGLLNELRQDGDDVYGPMSSHLTACLAAAKVFGSKHTLRTCIMNSALTIVDAINAVQLGFMRDHAEAIIKASPINYV